MLVIKKFDVPCCALNFMLLFTLFLYEDHLYKHIEAEIK